MSASFRTNFSIAASKIIGRHLTVGHRNAGFRHDAL